MSMDVENLKKYNSFRGLCIKNAEASIKAAELLVGKELNHIVYQLSIAALEEVGKIFIGFYQINSKEEWGKDRLKLPLDDHVKKLFWSIWGPSIVLGKFTKKDIDEFNSIAVEMHARRLDVQYTSLEDTLSCSEKISDEQAAYFLDAATISLNLAKEDGAAIETLEGKYKEDTDWFMEVSSSEKHRSFIFGPVSMEKLAEFQDYQLWIDWLKDQFQKEQKRQEELLAQELSRPMDTENEVPKWKIRFTITSPSHSIRNSELAKFNALQPFFQLHKKSVNSLMVDLVISNKTPIAGLWHDGWLRSKYFVAALNAATPGIFYWHSVNDYDIFYDRITDLETKKDLKLEINSGLVFDWGQRGMVLKEENLVLTNIVVGYFFRTIGTEDQKSVEYFAHGLGIMSKIDIHLRLELQCFMSFFKSLKFALIKNEDVSSQNLGAVGLEQIKGMLNENDTNLLRLFELGELIERNESQATISMADVLLIKQYAGLYLMTLAVRKYYNDKEAKLTKGE